MQSSISSAGSYSCGFTSGLPPPEPEEQSPLSDEQENVNAKTNEMPTLKRMDSKFIGRNIEKLNKLPGLRGKAVEMQLGADQNIMRTAPCALHFQKAFFDQISQ